MKRLLFWILFLFYSCFAFSQSRKNKPEKPDSAFTVPMITANYGMMLKGAEIANRFGMNYSVGGTFAFKNKNHWFYGIKGSYNWGSQVNETTIIDNLKTSEGMVIDDEGRLTFIYLEERGTTFFLTFGKLFNILIKNKNSGILAYGGIGTIHHKIKIGFKDKIKSLSEEYLKGYDRLSFGYGINGFLGYMHLSKNRFINFYGGIDLIYGHTQSLRKFNYDTEKPDTEMISNFMYGFNVGWIIRLNKRTRDEFYYD